MNKILESTIRDKRALRKFMAVGAILGFLLIVLFLWTAGSEPHPSWPRFWWIRPLIVVPFAGAMGGLFYHIMGYWRKQGGGIRVIADIISLLVFCIGLWLGFVLGLDGTYWN